MVLWICPIHLPSLEVQAGRSGREGAWGRLPGKEETWVRTLAAPSKWLKCWERAEVSPHVALGRRCQIQHRTRKTFLSQSCPHGWDPHWWSREGSASHSKGGFKVRIQFLISKHGFRGNHKTHQQDWKMYLISYRTLIYLPDYISGTLSRNRFWGFGFVFSIWHMLFSQDILYYCFNPWLKRNPGKGDNITLGMYPSDITRIWC